MEFIINSDRIYSKNENGKIIAEVTFPEMVDGIVNINRTFVDDSLRGQGVAGNLMDEVVKVLIAENKKAYLTCSYAIKWFESHPEYKNLVAII